MDVLITYDIENGRPDPHKPFLTAAEKEGLLFVWKGATHVNRLPNTTLWGVFDTTEAANEAFDRALKKTSQSVGYALKLEKRITTAMRSTFVNSDVRKKPEPRWTGSTSFETSRLHQVNDPFFR